MSLKNTVLVVGSAGDIGSHVVGCLQDQGLALLVLDDLSSGYSIDAVMHFAAFIQVDKSVVNPAKRYEKNVAKTLELLEATVRHNVKSFSFSSNAAIFGNPISPVIDEQHPQSPINPYGRSKRMIEQLLQDYELAYGLQSVCLCYFNAVGPKPDASLGERCERETHLMPLAIKAALGQGGALKVFGSDYPTPGGTCVRDYVHLCDLASAHLPAMEHLKFGGSSLRLNLGNESGYSVKQVLAYDGEVVGKAVPHDLVGRRAGDPAGLVTNTAQARSTLG